MSTMSIRNFSQNHGLLPNFMDCPTFKSVFEISFWTQENKPFDHLKIIPLTKKLIWHLRILHIICIFFPDNIIDLDLSYLGLHQWTNHMTDELICYFLKWIHWNLVLPPFTLLLRCSEKNGILAQINFGMLHTSGDTLWGNI